MLRCSTRARSGTHAVPLVAALDHMPEGRGGFESGVNELLIASCSFFVCFVPVFCSVERVLLCSVVPERYRAKTQYIGLRPNTRSSPPVPVLSPTTLRARMHSDASAVSMAISCVLKDVTTVVRAARAVVGRSDMASTAYGGYRMQKLRECGRVCAHVRTQCTYLKCCMHHF